MPFPEEFDPKLNEPRVVPNRAGVESEETELIRNDPAERAADGDSSAVNGGDADESSGAREGERE